MARTPFVAGNWKMNTTKAAAVELAKAVAQGVPRQGVEVGVAPPFVYLDAVGAGDRRLARAARGAGLLLREERRVHRRDLASRCSRTSA